ncbi:YaiO family outer membrane beta-barrel protein [Balneolales bacterium ANBcel1]|nr:YaiO family outer membrane beta-barrel protein [Balneolales bacterium ANBcel1]
MKNNIYVDEYHRNIAAMPGDILFHYLQSHMTSGYIMIKRHLFTFTNFNRVIYFGIAMLFAAAPGSSSASDTPFEAGIQHNLHVFSRVYDTQHQTSFHFGTNNSLGAYVLRLHRGNRFDQTAYQWEFESYPIISERLYAYAAYAYSDSEIFPRHRAGAELFSALPWRMEGSVGLRFLDFESADETIMITTSLSHYFDRYMATFRPYFIFSDGGSGQTWQGSIRRFINDEGDYLMIRAAIGRSSDETIFQIGQAEQRDVLLLKSAQIGAEGRYPIIRNLSGVAAITLYRQELSFDPGNYVNNWSFRAGITGHF